MKNTKLQLRQARPWLVSIALAMSGAAASAQSSDALLDKLIEKGVLTSAEAEAIRQEVNQPAKKDSKPKSGTAGWITNVVFSGDFRLRVDQLWPETSLTSPERLRFRMRLRFGAVWQATDWATIGARLGSGDARSSGDDGNPNSNNQTFTHFFSKKPLYLDAAYVTLRPPEADWISLTGGKMNKLIWEPAFNSPTIYDPDLTPEGAVEQLQFKFGPSGAFQAFANAGEFVLDELSGSTRDAYLFDAQAGITANLFGEPKSPALKTTLAGGYLLTQNLQGIPVADGSGNKGNLSNGTNYIANFNVVYGRGEVAWKICSQPFLGTPARLTFSGEYDRNLEQAYKSAGDQTTAWGAQIMFGQAAKKGQWQVAYQYKHVEADAVLDSLTDDDFGGTDRKGHVIKAAYNIRDWWQLGTTAFITQKISDRANSGHNQVGFNGENQVRLFVDTLFKF
jgi:Putative porin